MKKQVNHLRGINMYLDDRDRDIYYDVFTKTGYVIKPKDAKSFNILKSRYSLVFMGAVLAVNFLVDLKLTIIFSLLIILALEYKLRFKFLPQCIALPNFKKGRKAVVDSHEDKRKEVLRIILYVLFAGLIVANAYVANYGTLLIILSYIAGIVALIGAFRSFTYLRK